jgi:hypothetical protein
MKSLRTYQDIRKSENNKVKASLVDGDVDGTDIMTMVFDIFSKRKKFDYPATERLMLYMGFLGPVLRFLRCRCLNYDHMINVKKKFEKAKYRLEQDCDIIEVMDQVRKSKNF